MHAQRKVVLTWENFFVLVAFAAGIYSLYIAIYYALQLPLEQHAFRQTQTALTAYWLIQNGFGLAYETPVSGTPWTIPFEFPIYQYIVAIISDTFNVPLNPTGRIVSYIFLLACFVPTWYIVNKLQFHRSVFYIFVILVLSSPIYLYWGRTFMIETTALFFTISAIKYFIDAVLDEFSIKNMIMFSVLIAIAILQKSTTAFPVLGIMSIVYFVQEIRRWYAMRTIPWIRIISVGLICFLSPLVIGYAWVIFTDQVKMTSSFGANLTSTSLQEWNFGTLEQRYSKRLFVDVIWNRMLADNLGGIFGISLAMLALVVSQSFRVRAVMLASVFLGLMPIFIFSNLHMVHNYYQSANLIYFLFILALSIRCVAISKIGAKVAILFLALLVVSNYNGFASTYYLDIIKTTEDMYKEYEKILVAAKVLDKELPEDGQFVAFLGSWTSELSYISKRKSLSTTYFHHEYSTALTHPERFVDPGKLGAVVSCIDDELHVRSVLNLAAKKSWKVGRIYGCLIAVTGQEVSAAMPQLVECLGTIEVAEIENYYGMPFISFRGWFLEQGPDIRAASDARLYFIISDSERIVKYIEALIVYRPDVNKAFSIGHDEHAGLDALIQANIPRGKYSVDILRIGGGKIERCGIDHPLLVG